MGYYLLSVELCGIKSIEKKIRLDFYNKTVKKENFNSKGFNVKAIYGENGTGKSGIVHAVALFKNVITSASYLQNPTTQDLLHEMVNKQTRRFEFSCEFVYESDDFKIYRYCIELVENDENDYVIGRESLSVKLNSSSNKSQVIFSVDNGQIEEIGSATQEFFESTREHTLNMLSKQSIVNTVIRIPDMIENNNIFTVGIIDVLVFALYLQVHLDHVDDHKQYIKRISLEKLRERVGRDSLEYKSALEETYSRIMVDDSRVLVQFYDEYEKTIRKLEKFIKIFKEDLKSIDIDKKENGDYYDINLNLNYGHYSVNKEFESTGIKKLISLFECLYLASSGSVVFVDEMDANINDIYLCRLIEYFMYFGKGQLVFTTHNIDPMTFLKQNNKSIDFLTRDSQIVPWKKSGHDSPEVFYRSGYIQDIPFNVDAVDFIDILGGN